MNQNAARDDNRVPSFVALNEETGQVERVACDPITNEILVDVFYAADTTPGDQAIAKRDANYHTSTLAVEDDSAENVNAIRCGINSEILVELE